MTAGIFPSPWNISSTTFVHKNGDINDCDNYRCLSLTSCFGKLFTSLLQNRIHNYLDENDLYNKYQAGFRPDYRTTDHIFTIKTILNKYLYKQKKQVFACFVDFSKAFDSVWRKGLFKKISRFGITGKVLNIIRDMYSNSKFVVKKENIISHPSHTGRGVRQGDGLSPLLFNLFINDIDSIFNFNDSFPVQLKDTKLNCLLYADDLLLLSESKEGLQSCLDSLQSYCTQWKLKVNLNKTKIIIFSKGKKDYSKYQFKIFGSPIEIVEKYKYLGIIINFNGNFKHAAEHLYKQSLKALFSLRHNILCSNDIDIKMKLKLFDTLIKPICTYGSEIWISDLSTKESNLDKLPFEKIHNKFCKNILGVHKKSSNIAVKCELGRQPILNFITVIALKYFNRLKQLPSDRFLYEVYEVDKSLFNDGQRSWYSFIDLSLKNLNQDENSLDVNNITQILQDKYSHSLSNRLDHLSRQENDNKLFFFAKIYKEFKLQEYLSFKLPVSITKELTKLRVSAHSLLIEKGRYFRPKLEYKNRLCIQCNNVEDEEHFLLFCNKFSNLRLQLFQNLNMEKPNDLCPQSHSSTVIIDKLVNPNCIDNTKHVCSFISSSLVLR